MQIRVVEREVQEHREKEAAKEEEERKLEEAAATAVAPQQQEQMEVEEQPVSTHALAPSAIQHQPPSSEVGLGFADQSVAVAPVSSHVSG